MASHELDVMRLLCPMPVIKVQQTIQSLAPGELLHVYCTDPGTKYDIPAWCKVHGHSLMAIEQQGHVIQFIIRVE
jgi:tRNA 2-thiouridine synthesizing protein A